MLLAMIEGLNHMLLKMGPQAPPPNMPPPQPSERYTPPQPARAPPASLGGLALEGTRPAVDASGTEVMQDKWK